MIVLLDNVLQAYDDPVILFFHYMLYASREIQNFQLLSTQHTTIQQYLTSLSVTGDYLAGKFGPRNFRCIIWKNKRFGPAFCANNEKLEDFMNKDQIEENEYSEDEFNLRNNKFEKHSDNTEAKFILGLPILNRVNSSSEFSCCSNSTLSSRSSTLSNINSYISNIIPMLNVSVNEKERFLEIWEILNEAKLHFKLPHEIGIDPVRRLIRILRSALRHLPKLDKDYVYTSKFKDPYWVCYYFLLTEEQEKNVKNLIDQLNLNNLALPLVSISNLIADFQMDILNMKCSRFLKDSIPVSEFARYCFLIRHSIFHSKIGSRKDLILFWDEVWKEWLNSSEEERSKKMLGCVGVQRSWADDEELRLFIASSDGSEEEIDWFADDSFARSITGNSSQDSGGLELIKESEAEDTFINHCNNGFDMIPTSSKLKADNDLSLNNSITPDIPFRVLNINERNDNSMEMTNDNLNLNTNDVRYLLVETKDELEKENHGDNNNLKHNVNENIRENFKEKKILDGEDVLDEKLDTSLPLLDETIDNEENSVEVLEEVFEEHTKTISDTVVQEAKQDSPKHIEKISEKITSQIPQTFNEATEKNLEPFFAEKCTDNEISKINIENKEGKENLKKENVNDEKINLLEEPEYFQSETESLSSVSEDYDKANEYSTSKTRQVMNETITFDDLNTSLRIESDRSESERSEELSNEINESTHIDDNANETIQMDSDALTDDNHAKQYISDSLSTETDMSEICESAETPRTIDNDDDNSSGTDMYATEPILFDELHMDTELLKDPGALTAALNVSSNASSVNHSENEYETTELETENYDLERSPTKSVESKDESLPDKIEMFEKLSGHTPLHRHLHHTLSNEESHDIEKEDNKNVKSILKPIANRPDNSIVFQLKEFIENKPELISLKAIEDFNTLENSSKPSMKVRKGRSISEIFAALLDDNMKDLSVSAEYKNKIVRPEDLYNRIKVDTDKPWDKLSHRTKEKYYGAFLRKYDVALNHPENCSVDIIDIFEIVKVCVEFDDVKHRIVKYAINIVENQDHYLQKQNSNESIGNDSDSSIKSSDRKSSYESLARSMQRGSSGKSLNSLRGLSMVRNSSSSSVLLQKYKIDEET